VLADKLAVALVGDGLDRGLDGILQPQAEVLADGGPAGVGGYAAPLLRYLVLGPPQNVRLGLAVDGTPLRAVQGLGRPLRSPPPVLAPVDASFAVGTPSCSLSYARLLPSVVIWPRCPGRLPSKTIVSRWILLTVLPTSDTWDGPRVLDRAILLLWRSTGVCTTAGR
jgi:hypothetical protein